MGRGGAGAGSGVAAGIEVDPVGLGEDRDGGGCPMRVEKKRRKWR